jgi:hypothetical protein
LSYDINPQLSANLLEHGKEAPFGTSEMKNRIFAGVSVRDGKADRGRKHGGRRTEDLSGYKA